MSLKAHTRTRATVIRAGYYTTLVSLADWYGGQILAAVDTSVVQKITRKACQDLPGVELWVWARVDARFAEDLALKDWTQPTANPGNTKTAPPSEGDGAGGVWAGSPANTVPNSPWAA
ncbi:hypothetical protein [Streptomyces sp. V1I6]|uniref:hypothetical protein n=1 Tax=Streptomyces sp. V1I6 TaxID=3042273 RepID=UPI00278115C4|nr:hypothetical protein [Streptomyces sp. V1I6]MDQ0847747.1 hypothetical protein [Streptomyces sp. V1I6]